jgi:hypothetical protein
MFDKNFESTYFKKSQNIFLIKTLKKKKKKAKKIIFFLKILLLEESFKHNLGTQIHNDYLKKKKKKS